MKRTVRYIAPVLLMLLLAVACRKEKPAFDLSDKDPCSCASEVSAEFDIFELITTAVSAPGDVAVLTDDITNGQIKFSAKYPRANHQDNADLWHSESNAK
jgi:hypothetical protein